MGILKNDAGMKDVLLQSATIAEGSIKRALNGKSYNREIRRYKLFYEASVRLMITDILQGVEDCCMEGLTGKLLSISEFKTETYVEIMNDSKFSSMYTGFLDLKNQCNGKLSVQKLLSSMEIKQSSLLMSSNENKK